MKKRVEQLISGKFEYWVAPLIFSDESIETTISEGETFRGEFYFAAEDKSMIKGMLIADSPRILLSEEQFQGTTIHVAYGIDVTGLKPDAVIEAKISILSNIGQVDLPIKVTVVGRKVKASGGEIHSLEEFAALARENYREAFRVFKGENFAALIAKEHEQYSLLYSGMSRNPVTYQNMEEFLIATGMKEEVTLSLDKERKEAYRLENTMKDILYIHRSGWGYFQAEIELEGDFLEVEKRVISSEDFIGSVYGLEYVILKDHLGSGRKTAKIRIRTVYASYVCEISASAAGEYEISTHAFESRTKRDLMKAYMDRCLKIIDYRQWRDRTLEVLSELKDSGNYCLAQQLYEVWMWLEDDNIAKAEEMLAMLKNRTFGPEEAEEEGAYLWLCRKVGIDIGDYLEYLERLRTLQRRSPDSMALLYILLKEDEELRNSPLKQLDLLELQYERGLTSPFIYFEACKLLRTDAGLFRKLSDFMIQVLSYAGRHQLFTQELAMRTAHLAMHEKKFRTSVYRILSMAYEAYPGNDLLEAICRLIIMGDPKKKEYFPWYSLAVEEDIRITRLYEYYIETMSRNHQGSLPKQVQLYFSYNNTLSSERKAFIYAKVVGRKEQDPESYQMYEKVMEAFAAESLEKGRMNEDYAVLYQEFVKEIHSKAEGEALCRVMFTHRLYCDDPKVRNVVVCHQGLQEEEIYSLRDGVALINLYTDDGIILFEDAKQRRYASTVDYNLRKLMDSRELASQCMALEVADPGLILYACGHDPYAREVTIQNLECFLLASRMDEFDSEYKRKIRRKLLDYYDKNADADVIRAYLDKLDYDEFYKVDYLLLQDVLIRHDYCRKAFELIERYGFEGMRLTDLFKLCHKMILELEFAENEKLLYLTEYVVKEGKYDEVLLDYLRDSYIGSASDMIELWEKLRGFSMDAYTLEEEILLIAMYTRVNPPRLAKVLESYVKNRGKELVIQAAFTYIAYGYFLDDIRIDMFVFKSLEHMYEKGQELDPVCYLALLKRYRFCKKLTSYQRRNISQLVRSYVDQDLHFEFFKAFPSELIAGCQLEDKIFVEKRFQPNASVMLHYAICSGSEADREIVYKTEPMKRGFHGIFVREFLLFYGESLTYYLTVTEGEKSYDTEPETLLAEIPPQKGTTRYDLINQMLAARANGECDKCLQILESYRRREQMTRDIFQIID